MHFKQGDKLDPVCVCTLVCVTVFMLVQTLLAEVDGIEMALI